MSKLDKLIRDYKAAQKDKEALSCEVERLRGEQRRLTVEAEAAAEAGNLEEYQQKRNAAVQAADLLHVREKQIERLSCLRSEAEAKEAWADYAAGYNRDFEKAWKAYEAHRKALFDEYMQIARKQNEMLKLREECGDCCGLPRGTTLDNPADGVFPVALLPDAAPGEKRLHANFRQPDVNFFFAALLAGEEENSLLNKAVRLHVPLR